jgi:hypothetical protein
MQLRASSSVSPVALGNTLPTLEAAVRSHDAELARALGLEMVRDKVEYVVEAVLSRGFWDDGAW